MSTKWWTLLAVSGATFMLLLDLAIVMVALPEIQAGLHAGFGEVQWTVDAYALALAALLLNSGSLGDRYGRRRLFAAGTIIFTLASLLCGLAVSPLMLITARAAQGVGGASMYSTSLALLSRSFTDAKERAIAYGVWGGISAIAASLGPVLGGLITTGLSWRGIFLVNVPVGVAGLVVTALRVEESRDVKAARTDWVGAAVLTVGLAGLVYGLIRASETAWGNTGVIASLTVGGVLLACFAIVESRVASPMFDLRLLRIPAFAGGAIAALAINGSLFAMFLYFVLYLQDALGYSALATGVRLLLVGGACLVSIVATARLSERVPARWLIAAGLALTGLGLLMMAGVSGTSSWTLLIPGFIVSGAGSGIVNPPLTSAAVAMVPPDRSGMASGAYTSFRQIGLAVSVAAFGSVFITSVTHSLDHAIAAAPTVVGHGSQLANAIRQGNASQAIRALPPRFQAQTITAVRAAFAAAFDDLAMISGCVALVGGICAFVLFRPKKARDTGSVGAPTSKTLTDTVFNSE
jgi:EmrB/QacA subfamily drug resistance transporter